MNSLRTAPSRLTTILVFLVVVSVVGSFSSPGIAYADDQKPQRTALHQLQDAFTSLAEQMLPSVVSITSKQTITSEGQANPLFNDEFFKDFPFPIPMPETPQQRSLQSFGSGVIVRSDGYILTNDHVVGGADKVTVTLKDGRDFEGTVTRDPRSDLALVKIAAKNLPAAKLGDSSKVKVGSWAIAIGSPFGLAQTMTVGVVSAVGRQEAVFNGEEGRFYPNLIQTDASINPGNSGGPLINIDGEVIGINTLIRSSLGESIGIGFAVPSNTAKFVMDQLIAHGKVTRGYIGLVPEDLTPRDAEQYGVKEGVLVSSVEAGTPADDAGFQVEDVIVEIDGTKITSDIQFRDIITAIPPGKQITVTIVRDGLRKPLKVILSEAPEPSVAKTPTPPENSLGFSVADITPELAKKYDLEAGIRGVVVTGVVPGSAASDEGIEPGQVITRANGKSVSSAAEFSEATKGLKSGDTVRLVVQTKERTVLVSYTLD